MLDAHRYIIFLVTSLGFIVSPGPAVLLVISYGLNFGVKKSLFLIFGNSTGIFILSLLSLVVVYSFALISPMFLEVVKYLGILLLFYIALMLPLAKSRVSKNREYVVKDIKNTLVYKEGLFLALTNPKPIIFFVAIYPQFVDINSKYEVYNVAMLSLSFIFASFCILTLYSFLGKSLRRLFNSPKKMLLFNFVSGVIISAMAVVLIFEV